jgi:hypothetical protein
MQKQKILVGNGKAGHVINYITEKPMSLKPNIKNEYTDQDGVRMYLSEDGKTFIADVFDKLFNKPRTI